MKSYFAKLAARATLANAPSPSQTSSASLKDPFEESATEPVVPVVTGSAHHSPDSSPQPPAPRVIPESRTEVRRPEKLSTEPRELGVNETRQTPIPSEAEAKKSIAPRPSDVPLTFEVPEAGKRSHDDSPVQTRREVDTNPPALQPGKSISDAPSTGPKEIEKTQPASETNDRLDDLEKDQAALLRKADAFMAELMGRRRAPAASPEEPETHEQSQVERVRPNSLREAPARLEPVARPARVAEPVDNEPSVVIGKLSVEILPSPSPQSPPPQIIFRRGNDVRPRSGIPSSQRFGFTRF